MPTQAANVSVTLPVSQAIDRVKRTLFQPFDLGKWFTIGFCAWLARLGEAGGYHGNYNYNFNFGSRNRVHDFHDSLNHAWKFVLDNLYWILPVAIVALLIGFTIGLVLLWLNSRGKFMFLHCVALDRAEVGVPWRKFVRQGNSLFLFRLVLALIGMVLMLPLVAIIVVLVIRMIRVGEPEIQAILTLVGIGLTLIAVGFVFFLIVKLTTDFVVPIMYLRGSKCLGAWSELLGLISANLGRFLLYLLFQVALGLAVGALVLIAVLATCCVACCLMLIPYIGTVLLLPVLTFKRSYSLHYLAQYGREYDVFPPITAPAQGMGPPLSAA